jgi:hypothetical protein
MVGPGDSPLMVTASFWARTKSADGDELAAATANTKNTRTCE